MGKPDLTSIPAVCCVGVRQAIVDFIVYAIAMYFFVALWSYGTRLDGLEDWLASALACSP